MIAECTALEIRHRASVLVTCHPEKSLFIGLFLKASLDRYQPVPSRIRRLGSKMVAARSLPVPFGISRTGTTRLVVVIGPWALKFARNARGRRCNSYEARLFREVDARRRAMLCPVLRCPKGDWLLVMATAIPLTEAEKDRLIDADGFPDWDYFPGEDGEPFEYKASDWGWFDGRLVALDYSTPAFDTPEEHAALARCPCRKSNPNILMV